MSLGTLYMIPVPLSEQAWHTLSPAITEHSSRIRYFFVENIREARRFLKGIDKTIDIDALSFSETNRNTPLDIRQLLQWLKAGWDVGVISDAGCPGIADPGAELAMAAQKAGARVVPLIGPSSILLALMASGLNGQSFCFNGYLPVKEPQRSKKIKEAEALSAREHQTQLFIETPYRNNQLLADLLKNCRQDTLLCIAENITAANERIETKTVQQWQQLQRSIEKIPAIFLLLAGSR